MMLIIYMCLCHPKVLYILHLCSAPHPRPLPNAPPQAGSSLISRPISKEKSTHAALLSSNR